MIKYLKFASIDIGSNAIRLLFTNVFLTPEGPEFRKASLIRVPLRLGDDAFVKGKIGKEKRIQFVDTMMAFASMMKVHGAISYKAFATSAMRQASNAQELIERVKDSSGIDIEIITGETEANLISTKFLPTGLPEMKEALFIDVGGGSTELTLFKNRKKSAKCSRKIGTIRQLNNIVKPEEWQKLEKWLEKEGLKNSKVPVIGSGGNINKIYKVKRSNNTDLFVQSIELYNFLQELEKLSVDERIVKHFLNPDRADVIVPALQIFTRIIDFTKTDRVYVPKSGLSDGIARELYRNYMNAQKAKNKL